MMLTTLFSRRLLRPLLGLAVLAAALVALGGQAQPADAATSYTVEVRFQDITLRETDDGCTYDPRFDPFPCSRRDTTLEVYASLGAGTGPGSGGVKNLGSWGRTGGCEGYWSEAGAGQCTRRVYSSTYRFAEAEMCSSSTYAYCEGAYSKYNNRIRFTVTPGQTFRVFIDMEDYDSGSSNDKVCKAERSLSFTDAQLQTLDQTFGMGQGFNGNASCTVQFNVRRV